MWPAVLAMATMAPFASFATTVDETPAALPVRSTGDARPTAALDLSRATLRDAARSSALASDADPKDVAPDPDQARHDTKVLALPSIRPTCSLLVGIASVVAVEAACIKNHCAGTDTMNAAGTLTSRPVVRPLQQPANCQPKTIKLW